MITTTIDKLPKICRSCGRLRCKSKLYNCKANLIFPKKPTCGRHKDNIKARFKRFLVENSCFCEWYDNRQDLNIRGREILSDPYSVLYQSFVWTPAKLPKEFWRELNKKWQEIIKTEYPEYLPKG